MSDGKTAVLTRKSPLEKFASFCGSAAAWLAAGLFGLAAASLIARMDLLDVSTLAEGKALRVGISLPELLLFVVLTALLAGLCRLLRGLDDQKKANRLIAGGGWYWNLRWRCGGCSPSRSTRRTTRTQSGRWPRRWRAGTSLAYAARQLRLDCTTRPAPIRALPHCLWSCLSGLFGGRCAAGMVAVWGQFPPRPACWRSAALSGSLVPNLAPSCFAQCSACCLFPFRCMPLLCMALYRPRPWCCGAATACCVLSKGG